MTLVGQTVGKYRIDREIGSGGMGTVYQAVDTYLDRPVAFKVLTGLEGSVEGKERFLREARVVARLDHRNVIRIHDAGDYLGFPFIAMEYVDGRDGRSFLESQPPLTQRLDVFAQICEGLSVAHEQGVVHRDIKPANFIVTRNGVVKLIDFGLARVADDHRDLTKGQVFGSASYMAPEQILHPSAVDYRTDLFAAGALLYEILSGNSPFRGATVADTIMQVVKGEPEPIALVAPGLPQALYDLVEQALRKDPSQRPSSAAELAAIVRDATHEISTAALSAASSGIPTFAAGRPARTRAAASTSAPLAPLALGSDPAASEGMPADRADVQTADVEFGVPAAEDGRESSSARSSRPEETGEEPTRAMSGLDGDVSVRRGESSDGARWRYRLAWAGITIGAALIAGTVLLVTLRRKPPAPASTTTPALLRSVEALRPLEPPSQSQAPDAPATSARPAPSVPGFLAVDPAASEVTVAPGEERVFSVSLSGPSGPDPPRWIRNDVSAGEGTAYRFRAGAPGTRELLVVTWGAGATQATRIWYVNTGRPVRPTVSASGPGLGR